MIYECNVCGDNTCRIDVSTDDCYPRICAHASHYTASWRVINKGNSMSKSPNAWDIEYIKRQQEKQTECLERIADNVDKIVTSADKENNDHEESQA